MAPRFLLPFRLSHMTNIMLPLFTLSSYHWRAQDTFTTSYWMRGQETGLRNLTKRLLEGILRFTDRRPTILWKYILWMRRFILLRGLASAGSLSLICTARRI